MDTIHRKRGWVSADGSVREKDAELSNTYGVSNQAMDMNPPKTGIKTAALSPHVSVSGKHAPTATMRKEAQFYALPYKHKYPLDQYDQVKLAADYFDEWGNYFEPRERRVYCENLVKRASALGISVSDEVRRYGGSEYGDPSMINMSIDVRRGLVSSPELSGTLDKLAAARPMMPPDDWSLALHEFDKLAGLDSTYGDRLVDPYFTTFRPHGELSKEASDTAYAIGSDMTTAEKLRALGAKSNALLVKTFGEDFAEEFRKEPEAIYKSMPMDQKKVLIRMANEATP